MSKTSVTRKSFSNLLDRVNQDIANSQSRKHLYCITTQNGYFVNADITDFGNVRGWQIVPFAEVNLYNDEQAAKIVADKIKTDLKVVTVEKALDIQSKAYQVILDMLDGK